MSEAISTISPGGLEDRRATIGSSQFARVMSVSASWTKLRLAFRMTVTDSGANLAGTPRLVFGLMNAPSAGVANGPLSASTSHFLGFRTYGLTWARNAGVYYSSASMLQAFKRVGTTDTISNHVNTVNFSAMESTGRWPYVFDITKGSPNYSYDFAYPAITTALDFSEAEVARAMESDTLNQAAAYLTGLRGSFTTFAGTIACDEGANGTLDSIMFGWNQTASLLNVSDIHYKVIV
jgi:hypothetical protein